MRRLWIFVAGLMPFVLMAQGFTSQPPSPTSLLPQCDSGEIKRNCTGNYQWPDGAEYVGEFRDGKPDGIGTITLPNGNKFNGEYRDGRLNGRGMFTSSDGTTYIGEYRDGKRDGWGKQFFPDGRVIEGSIRGGRLDGWAKISLRDGRYVVGEFREDRPNGRVELIGSDGRTFQGEVREGRPNGEGVEILSDGTVRSGRWENGSLVQSYHIPRDRFSSISQEYERLRSEQVNRSDSQYQERERMRDAARIQIAAIERQRIAQESAAVRSQQVERARGSGPSLDEILKLQQIVGNAFGGRQRGNPSSQSRDQMSCTQNGWLLQCSRGREQVSCTRNGWLVQCSDGSSCTANGNLITCN